MKRVLTVIVIMSACSCWAAVDLGKEQNPEAVAQVAAGKLAIANAAWWGFDGEDATSALQAAIDSKAKTVIVPYMGEPWIVRPIFLRSNLELVFEPGVLVLAKKGEFKGRWDCLLTATDQSDITIRGYGAILRMRKRDYRNPPYPENEEWKHGIKLESCKRILIEGLRIESSGGDGFYLGMANRGMAGNEDIVIRDCVSHDNHRQGISVIDAKNLLVENCVFSGTEGTGPSAGVDFEPNDPEQLLVNCVFRNCLFENNAGHGMFVRAHDTVTADSPPISIRFENCTSRMSVPGEGGDGGMVVRAPGDNGPRGLIEFINCTSENMGEVGANVYGHSIGNLKVRYVNCNWKSTTGPAVRLNLEQPSMAENPGKVEFVNCTIYDDKAGPSVQILSGVGGDYRQDFNGTITVHNQHGARMEIDPASVQVDLRAVDGTGAADDTVGQSPSFEGVFGRTMPPRNKSAKNRADHDDESTFGALWETHDFIADLPRDWRLKLDFKDEGEKQKWYAIDVDEAGWQPVQIGDWWEPQGYHYDGIAWYRVDFTVPATAVERELVLSFGAVDESAWVYLNGEEIGEFDQGAVGWDKRFEIPLGDAVKIGSSNVLAVRVRDRWNYGGIWKSVKLAAEKRAD